MGKFSSTALAALLITGVAFAGASAQGIDPATGARPGNIPGTGNSLPLSDEASNINARTVKSSIAPRLPTPASGDDGEPVIFLRDARGALISGRTGEAQEALERAQTRWLSREIPGGTTGSASDDPRIERIRTALQELSKHDRRAAVAALDGIPDLKR
jgi:hypothetical protein